MTASKEPTKAAPPTDSYCAIAKPIFWSAKDTDQTLLQVKQHNAVWKKMCEVANTP